MTNALEDQLRAMATTVTAIESELNARFGGAGAMTPMPGTANLWLNYCQHEGKQGLFVTNEDRFYRLADMDVRTVIFAIKAMSELVESLRENHRRMLREVALTQRLALDALSAVREL